jgi:predicted nuclease of restriction endonuclease-like (RecB) superfamily
MTSGWGNFVVDNLAKDLKREFPEMQGFSSRNLYYMKKWVQFYNSQKLPQAVAEIKNLVISIPWGHNWLILEKIRNPVEAPWYVSHVIENGISRNVLLHQIGWDLYIRQVKEKKLTNFAATLPPLQSDLAEKTLKDPYIFDFLTLGNEVHKREIENELTKHITNFLLELGTGFAFMGKQVQM